VTGGMTSGPSGSPCFIANDGWFLDKPAHLGVGPYSRAERQVYQPQWFMHEFYHHLFGAYPALQVTCDAGTCACCPHAQPHACMPRASQIIALAFSAPPPMAAPQVRLSAACTEVCTLQPLLPL